jgi:Ser/Thr protein kinase RdoA (MazF antagonist)
MEIFTTAYSTLSATAVGNLVEKRYNLSGLHCKLLLRNVSDTYLLEGKTDLYIFKIFRKNYRSFEQLEGEAELLHALKQANISISYVIKDLKGQSLQAFNAAEGLRYGLLYSYAKGKPNVIPTDEQLTVIGKTIANMHQVTAVVKLANDRPTYNFETTLHRPLKLVKQRFAELPDEFSLITKMAALAENKLSSFNLEEFSYGYCHYDLFPKNFHFDENDQITLFDFDWMGKGYLANDLMVLHIHYFLLVDHQLMSQEDADRCFALLIENYSIVRPFSAQELQALPYLGVMFFIFAFGFYEENYEDFSITFYNLRFIKERVGLIKKYLNKHTGANVE